MPQRRTTQKDIAAAAKVSQVTVSLALGNHPRIPEKTRKRIHKIAQEMNYFPDAMLRSLAAYRTSSRPVGYTGSLAWINNYPDHPEWPQGTFFQYYLDGAKARAAERGYKVENFWLAKPGLSHKRATQILESRNIKGLFVAPQPQAHMSLEFDWAKFAAVRFGHTMKNPRLHQVATNYVQSMNTIFDHVRRRGYQRVGFYILPRHDDRTKFRLTTGFLGESRFMPRKNQIPPLVARYDDDAAIKKWITRYQPDMIISPQDDDLLRILAEMGLNVPEDVAIVNPVMRNDQGPVTGINEMPYQLGVYAADFLVSLVQGGHYGVPEIPQRLLMDGVWHEGKTIRPMPEESTAPVDG